MRKIILLNLLIFSCLAAEAQAPFVGDTYSQLFNSYVGTAASLPDGWTSSSSVYNGMGDGTSSAAGNWSYGADAGVNRSLGSLTDHSTGTITFCVDLVNNTGELISAFDIAYRFKQWRYGNTDGFTVTGTGGLSAADLSGLGHPALPSGSGSNGINSFVIKEITVSGLHINNGTQFGVCFHHINGDGDDSGVAVDDFNISLSTSPLPVSLKSFEAKAMTPNAVELVWVTETEHNNHYFEAQHSRDGQLFESFDKKNGAGTSTQIHQYRIMHETAIQGTNYYRIKQVDFDGNFSYSPIRVVEVKGGNGFSLYPNLTVGNLHVVSTDYTKRKGTVEIFDLKGNIYQELILDAGTNHMLLDVSMLDTGFYFVRINSDGELAMLKFVKQ